MFSRCKFITSMRSRPKLLRRRGTISWAEGPPTAVCVRGYVPLHQLVCPSASCVSICWSVSYTRITLLPGWGRMAYGGEEGFAIKKAICRLRLCSDSVAAHMILAVPFLDLDFKKEWVLAIANSRMILGGGSSTPPGAALAVWNKCAINKQDECKDQAHRNAFAEAH